MPLTREQIWTAANELDAAGQKPTLAAVRKAVGGGSYTTIQEAMVEWRARRAAKELPAREPAPQAVADRLAELGAEVWAAALDLANARLASEREALDEARAEADAARVEAMELADQLTVDLDEATRRAAALEEAEQAACTEAEQLRQRLAAAESRCAELERQAAELRRENDQAQAAAGEARERAASLAGRLEALEQQNAALMARLAPQEDSASPS